MGSCLITTHSANSGAKLNYSNVVSIESNVTLSEDGVVMCQGAGGYSSYFEVNSTSFRLNSAGGAWLQLPVSRGDVIKFTKGQDGQGVCYFIPYK